MDIETERLRLRPWRAEDERSLADHANDRRIWRNLTNRFPHPYTAEAARDWIALQSRTESPVHHFAIEIDGQAVGGAGAQPGDDLHTRTAEVGYWLGARFWGRGFATEALVAITAYAFEHLEMARLEAGVLAWNPASARVLEKAGYELESIQRRNVFKDGEIIDNWLYVKLR